MRWALIVFLLPAAVASAQQAGTIRGMVYDKDFDAPLALAKVRIDETGQEAVATEQGNYVFDEVAPGTYTLVFSKDGYAREVIGDVIVTTGKMTEVDARLSGEFTEMEEFVVEELRIGGGTEAGLLELRRVSPSLMDAISADLMSRAGAGDAASALKLVAGATVEDDKYAVIRGLPDRYVNAQMNAVRLPTADEDKRAVQLDQFPSAAIESVRISKTFTPDQQGDASGGAVNVVLKGIPDQNVLKFSMGSAYNKQVADRSDFLTYRGGGVNFLGMHDGDRDIPADTSGIGVMGVSRDDAPIDYNWSFSAGGKHDFDSGVRVGGLVTLFYERDSSFYDDGIEDDWWAQAPGEPMAPQLKRQGQAGSRRTALYDVTYGSESVQWGGLGVLGAEIEDHSLTLAYLRTQSAEDSAILSEDTRGKEYFFPGHDPDDPDSPGFGPNGGDLDDAPYLRGETLRYLERRTETLQLSGRHRLSFIEFGREGVFKLLPPEIDWTLAASSSEWHEPGKTQFSTKWQPGFVDDSLVPFGFPPIENPAVHQPYRPAALQTVGSFQWTWKDIVEDSDQYFANVKFPFTQWSGDEGYVKFGIFRDEVERTYEQESFSNFGESGARFEGGWDEFWSRVWPSEGHPILEAPSGDDAVDGVDTDYLGEQDISAWYYMADVPLCSWFKVIGGGRYEQTKLSIVTDPEPGVQFVNLEEGTITQPDPSFTDVAFDRKDFLPAMAFEFHPVEQLTFRGAYSETIARQTFKELSPIQQQEFLGADIFIGNPALTMSELKNYDLRLDYRPYPGGLLSVSWFNKQIKDPIEYVQETVSGLTFTTPLNFPEGELSGYEFEVRQRLGHFWPALEGLTIGGNATFIDSEVTLPNSEFEKLDALGYPLQKRQMVNAPEHLYNLFVTYDIERTGTRLGLFYTVRGDTLVVGAGQAKGNFIPSIYETEHGTLNFSLSQKLGEHWTLDFKCKNLTNPDIETVYRSQYTPGDMVRSSYRKGMEFSIMLSASF